MNPAEITRLITTAPSAGSLLSVLESEMDGPAFQQIQVAAAVTRLAKVRHEITHQTRKSDTYRAFVQRLADTVERGDLGVREAANTFWAIVKMKEVAPELLQIVPALLALLDFHVWDMGATDICNVIWAMAGLDSLPVGNLLGKVVERAIDRADDFDPEGVSALFWASAQLSSRAPQLLAMLSVLCEVSATNLHEVDPQGLANVIWAIAKLQKQAACVRALLPACLQMIPRRVGGMNLANIFWSLAVLREDRVESAPFMPLLVEAAINRSSAATYREIANMVWSAGQLGLGPTLAQPLCCAVAPCLLKRKPSSVAQDYANLCWGFAGCSWRNETLMQNLAMHITDACASWHDKDVIFRPPMIMLAFAKLGIRSAAMMQAFAGFTLHKLPRFNDWQICALAWSYDELDAAGEFAAFRGQLGAEIVAKRGIPPERVLLCQAGPAEWSRS